MRRLLPFLCFILPVLSPAQSFNQLATDYTGSQLTFTTNFRLKGAEDDNRSKIFAWRNGRFTKMTEAANLDPATGIVSNQLSSDGLLSAWVARTGSGFSFSSVPFINGVAVPDTGLVSGVAIARNGPWIAYFVNGIQTRLTLRHRLTGVERVISIDTVPQLSPEWQLADRFLTNDGAVLVRNGRSGLLALITADGLRTLGTAQPAYKAWIDSTGSLLAYTDNAALHVRDLASGQEVTLSPVPAPVNYAIADVAFDDLGQSLVLNAAGDSVYRYRRGDPNVTLISIPDESVAAATLSGDGTKLFVITQTGRLLRQDLPSGKIERLNGKTPDPLIYIPALVPGSLANIVTKQVTYNCGGIVICFPALTPIPAAFLSPSEPPLQEFVPGTTSYLGLSVSFNGKPSPLWSVTRDNLRFQTPWDLAPGTSVMFNLTTSETEFESPQTITLKESAPDFESGADGAKVFHSDFRPITWADPATAGEPLQAFLTGIGPLPNHPPTGELPGQPIAGPTISCEGSASQGPQRMTLTVPTYLSSQFLGIYQAIITVPDDISVLFGVPNNTLDVICRRGDFRVVAPIPVGPRK